MKRTFVLALWCISALSGCATARLYPVRGPLSAQTPVPVFKAKMMQGPIRPNGPFSAVLNNGEVCKGTWKAVRGITTGVYPPAPDLSAEWDDAYGTGYYKFKVQGAGFFLRGEAKGNRGTVLNVEMYGNEIRPALPTNSDIYTTLEMAGVAKDDKGNVYKMVFSGPASWPIRTTTAKQVPD